MGKATPAPGEAKMVVVRTAVVCRQDVAQLAQPDHVQDMPCQGYDEGNSAAYGVQYCLLDTRLAGPCQGLERRRIVGYHL